MNKVIEKETNTKVSLRSTQGQQGQQANQYSHLHSNTSFLSDQSTDIMTIIPKQPVRRLDKFQESVATHARQISKFWQFISKGESFLHSNMSKFEKLIESLSEKDQRLLKNYNELKNQQENQEQFDLYEDFKENFIPARDYFTQEIKVQNKGFKVLQDQEIQLESIKNKGKLKPSPKNQTQYNIKKSAIWLEFKNLLLFTFLLSIILCSIPFLKYNMIFPSWKAMKDKMNIIQTYKLRLTTSLEIAVAVGMEALSQKGYWSHSRGQVFWRHYYAYLLKQPSLLHEKFEKTEDGILDGISTLKLDQQYYVLDWQTQQETTSQYFYKKFFEESQDCLYKQKRASSYGCVTLINSFSDDFFQSQYSEIAQVEKALLRYTPVETQIFKWSLIFTAIILLLFLYNLIEKILKLQTLGKEITQILYSIPMEQCQSISKLILQFSQGLYSDNINFEEIETQIEATYNEIEENCLQDKSTISISNFEQRNYLIKFSFLKQPFYVIIFVILLSVYLFEYKWGMKQVPSGEVLGELYKEYSFIIDFNTLALRSFSKLLSAFEPLTIDTGKLDLDKYVKIAEEYSVKAKKVRERIIEFRQVMMKFER